MLIDLSNGQTSKRGVECLLSRWIFQTFKALLYDIAILYGEYNTSNIFAWTLGVTY